MQPPDALRLFVAILIPADVLEAVNTLQTRLRAADGSHAVHWTALASIHVTLKFLGSVPAADVKAMTQALDTAAIGISQFDLGIDGAGVFPHLRAPRIFWTGISGDVQALIALRDRVEAATIPLGFPTEARAYTPHITIGRTRQDSKPAALRPIVDELTRIQAGTLASWHVDAFYLMTSTLNSSGAVYTPLEKIALH